MQRFTDPATTIHVKAGEMFALSLPGNPSTGYTWQASVDPRFLEPAGQEFVPEGKGVGAGGYEVVQLRAVAAGRSEIACEYRRPWERAALKTTQFQVVIQ